MVADVAAAGRVRPVRRGLGLRLRSRAAIGVFMCLPLIVLIGRLVAYPFFYSIYLSMLNKRETAFVGLDNFRYLMTLDTFWMVVQFSFLFTFLAVLWKAILGFTLALVIHTLPARGQRIWRGLSLIPWVMPLALSSLGWWWIYEPTHSALNWVLALAGIGPKPWLSEPFWARFSVILVNIWYGTPFFMIIYLAGLKSIPLELFESAAIDGAGAAQRLRYVTLPMLKNIIAVTLLFSTIVTLATFDIIRVLTRGGPRHSTQVFGTYAFELGIATGDVPLGAAVSLFMFPILAMLVRIFLPVAVPGLIAATIFAFTVSWSGFLYPLAFIFSSDQQVLTAGTVTSLIKGDVYHWGGLMAGALLACLPPVFLYVFLMDYYISGLTAGSTKG